MRPKRALHLLALGAWVLISTHSSARAAQQAVADSARAGPPAPPDSTRASSPAPVDTSRASAGAHVPTRVASPTPVIPAPSMGVVAPVDMIVERKLGVASLEDVLPLRRALFVAPLPLFGPTEGSLALPDGGGRLRLNGWEDEAEHTTDEPLLGSNALGWGAPWLAFGLGDPRADAVEALDLDAIESPIERPEFHGPGDSFVRLHPTGPVFARSAADTLRTVASKTTLVYQRGDGDAKVTGARFQTSAFRRRGYASYSRNQANGSGPLSQTVSARYEARVELVRALAHRIEAEGFLYERSIKDSIGAESEWDQRHVVLSATRDGERWSDVWRLRLSHAKETWILSPDANLTSEASSRERWQFPTIAAEGSMAWRPDPTLTWIATVEAASRKIVYRADSVPAFEPRKEEARLHLGTRWTLGRGAGAGLDAAYDVRESQPGLVDARASLWGATRGLRARLDLESAHDRPSWVDLLTPAKLRQFLSIPENPTVVVSDLFRSGDPGLKPRRLTGALASAGITVSRGFRLDFSGTLRRVTDDFGWDVSVDTVGGSYMVSSTARARGSGWLSHAACGWEFRGGPIRTRGVGWIRGGSDSLSPRSGSPPRSALDAAFDVRIVLFQGDLPLRFGFESHARGPRRGLTREPGQVTWDGSLSADFGSAGAFLRVENALDRTVGSAIWDPAEPSGAPLPGRAVHAGVTWNLLD